MRSYDEEEGDNTKNDDQDFERSYIERYNELQDIIREGNDLLQEIVQER